MKQVFKLKAALNLKETLKLIMKPALKTGHNSSKYSVTGRVCILIWR